MKNINRLILGLVVTMFVAPMVMALAVPSSVSLPVDQHGKAVAGTDMMGRKYKVFSNTTTETVVCSHACVLYGIHIDSGATTNYLVLRDTATADGSGTSVFPKIYMAGSGANKEFPVASDKGFPVLFPLGLTIDANAADGFNAVVLYKD